MMRIPRPLAKSQDNAALVLSLNVITQLHELPNTNSQVFVQDVGLLALIQLCNFYYNVITNMKRPF